jgi:isopentenyl phosphate kinase
MIFLKLGGSLITDKAKPETPRRALLRRLAGEIGQAWIELGQPPLLLGHGSGSFGHPVAHKHQTHLGVSGSEAWRGFAEVWAAAACLNHLVMQALQEADLPAIAFPPSASAICQDGMLRNLAIEPLRQAIQAGLLPVIYGDVAFDSARGGCILSTESVFGYLAPYLHPTRILLAGLVPGVLSATAKRGRPLATLRSRDLPAIELSGAPQIDVTGGMAEKVRWALALAKAYPETEVRIFSAKRKNALLRALRGYALGTRIVGG